MSDPSVDVMRRRDGEEAHTPKPADVMATTHLSGSDENQNQVTQEQKQHWGSSCKDHQSTTSSNVQSNGYSQSTNMMAAGTEAATHTDASAGGSSSSSSSSSCGAAGPNPSVLASLRSLGEHSDPALLPQSLHQIAEAYFLKEDYRWAVHFLQLERLYHQRLLSNLATLQEQWESQLRVGGRSPRADASLLADWSREESERMDSLRHICRTHQRPALCLEKNMVDHSQTDGLRPPVNGLVQQAVSSVENTHKRAVSGGTLHRKREPEEEEEEEEMVEEEQVDDEDDDLWEEQDDEEEEGVEELYGETADSKGLESLEDLAKLIEVEEMCPANGLVSILKRRVAEGGAALPASCPRRPARRKVRFSESYEDDANADSCLMFMLLCLVTVVISIGGTALYCLLGNASTTVCTDFFQNMDVFWAPVRSGVGWLTQRLFPVS